MVGGGGGGRDGGEGNGGRGGGGRRGKGWGGVLEEEMVWGGGEAEREVERRGCR